MAEARWSRRYPAYLRVPAEIVIAVAAILLLTAGCPPPPADDEPTEVPVEEGQPPEFAGQERQTDTQVEGSPVGEPPSSVLDASLRNELDALRSQSLHRSMRTFKGLQGPRMIVDGRPVLMMGGSNYLDLAGDPRVLEASEEAVRAYGTAAAGSRLINGNLDLHEALECELAEFVGSEGALVFSTGYMANLGVLTALAGSEDVIVSDALNHASIIDACRLSGAAVRVFRHSDAEDLLRVARDLEGFRRRIQRAIAPREPDRQPALRQQRDDEVVFRFLLLGPQRGGRNHLSQQHQHPFPDGPQRAGQVVAAGEPRLRRHLRQRFGPGPGKRRPHHVRLESVPVSLTPVGP